MTQKLTIKEDPDYDEIIGPDGKSIAMVQDKKYARMFAAAPDLYEALETQCAYCVGREAKDDPCENCIIGKALRKARGEK